MTAARLFASFFGSGHLRQAPGTAGSLAALPFGAVFLLVPPALPIAVLLAVFGGLWAVHRAEAGNDPQWVVIDEVAGMWIALLGLSRLSLTGVIAAFLLFRLLDILKPGPIGWADRQHGAAAVMADDVIAGAIAAGILWATRSRWPGLI